MGTGRGVWEFHDRVIVITGASAGIGRALAVALAREGALLVVAARRKEALDEVAAEIEALGSRALAVAADVAVPEDCARLIQETIARFGRIDALVNNAGVSMWARFEELEDLSILDRLMRVNYLGAAHCTYHALPYLRQRQGLLVAVSSLTGKTGVPTRSGYAASKHAMQGFFDSLRVELMGSGVDVLVISPGFVETDIRANAFGTDGAARGESPRDESENTMSLTECTALIVEAMRHRRRELVMTRTARVGQWVKLIAPGLIDRVAARMLREKDQ